MWFSVSRASWHIHSGDDKPPCAGAVFVDNNWHVELHSLEELIVFLKNLKKADSVILDSEQHIQIYDDYVE